MEECYMSMYMNLRSTLISEQKLTEVTATSKVTKFKGQWIPLPYKEMHVPAKISSTIHQQSFILGIEKSKM